jgi:hypothetical protein
LKAANKPTSLQTTIAIGAHLAEGQLLHEEHALNNVKFLIYRAGTRRPRLAEGQLLHEEHALNNVKFLIYRAGTRRPTSLQTTLAIDAHLAERQLLQEEQALNNSDIPGRNLENKNFQNGRAEFETGVNLSEKESIEVMSHHT